MHASFFRFLSLFALAAALPVASAQPVNPVTTVKLTPGQHHFFADRSGSVTFTVELKVTKNVGAPTVRLSTLDPKWTFDSAAGPLVKPAVGDQLTWDFAYAASATDTLKFTVKLNYAADLADPDDAVYATQVFTLAALLNNVPAQNPDGTPLQTTALLSEARIHSADTDRSLTLELTELLKVIQLYNTRVGGLRTGTYDDTFEPAPGAITPPTVFHSADLDRDGAIGLVEVMRVADLCRFTQAGRRTGEYHFGDALATEPFVSGP